MDRKRFGWKLRDWFKAAFYGAGTGVGMAVQQSLSSGSINLTWKLIGMAAVGGAITSLVKSYVTDDLKSATKIIEKSGMMVVEKPIDPADTTITLPVK